MKRERERERGGGESERERQRERGERRWKGENGITIEYSHGRVNGGKSASIKGWGGGGGGGGEERVRRGVQFMTLDEC